MKTLAGKAVWLVWIAAESINDGALPALAGLFSSKKKALACAKSYRAVGMYVELYKQEIQ